MHADERIVHKTKNLYAAEDRDLFFISDAPHLLKTIRNNLEHSRSGGTRCLWVSFIDNVQGTQNNVRAADSRGVISANVLVLNKIW